MTTTEFRRNTGDALARAAAGEIIEITRNNRTIAELRPRHDAHAIETNAARRDMIDILRTGFHLGGGPFTEDDKYGDAAL